MHDTADPFKRLTRARVDDALFAHAYDAVSEGDKAAFKRCVAAHFAAMPPQAATRFERTVLRDGLTVSRRLSPADAVLVLLPDAPVSPLKLLAALMPALTRGAGATAVVRPEGSAWEDGVLTALELAGQEDVFAPSQTAVTRFFSDAAKAGRTAVVIDLAQGASGFAVPAGIRVWRAPAVPALAVFFAQDGGTEPDTGFLARMHPDSRLTAWNGPRRVKGVPARTGSLDDMLAARPDAAVVPVEAVDAVSRRLPLTLGHGCEALWFWPEFDAAFLHFVHVGCTEGE